MRFRREGHGFFVERMQDVVKQTPGALSRNRQVATTRKCRHLFETNKRLQKKGSNKKDSQCSESSRVNPQVVFQTETKVAYRETRVRLRGGFDSSAGFLASASAITFAVDTNCWAFRI